MMDVLLFDELLGFSLFWKFIMLLCLTHLTIVSVTLYLHRYETHKSFELHPVASHFFHRAYEAWYLQHGNTTQIFYANALCYKGVFFLLY